ncbi:hypothetical protein NQ318_009935, partial [Aromia moschata]
MDDKIKLVLHNVQKSVSCHQKNLKVLESVYQKVKIKLLFQMDITVRNPYVERTLDFLAQLVAILTKPDENETQLYLDEDSPSHPFLTQVINETLKYHDLDCVQARYHSCRFITLILNYIGHDNHLDSDICDSIQEAMLERTLDIKASIRLQAVLALVRLQEPYNPDCPVINAYQSLLVDGNPHIRKVVVRKIAPTASTIPKIFARISDVDYNVRIAAYEKCADIGPAPFKIFMRQKILENGFHEGNKRVKNILMETLLPNALRLDADENDILNSEEISKQVMEAFFRTTPVKDIIEYLPIDGTKLIPLNRLSSESVSYWTIVTNFVRSSDDAEEFIDTILPELTLFCNYLQNVIDSKMSQKMNDWENMDFQYLLINLFDIAELLAGELSINSLCRFYKIIIKIASKLSSNIDIFTNDICHIISDIREPLVDKPAIQEENADKNFQIAELKVKINILQGDIEDALDSQEYQKAAVIQTELTQVKSKLEDLSKPTEPEKIRVSADDPETVCRCLDLLTALLLLPDIKVLSASLATCKNEFVLPLLTSNVVEINWRVLRCLSLYSLLDRSVAEEHIKVLCIPIATYRAIPNHSKSALTESVAAVCDLMRFYGPEIFGSEEDSNHTTSTQNTTRRRLYRNECLDDVTAVDQTRMNVEFIIEIILDMLDDEVEEIRETAILGITKLVLTEFPIDPLLISRVILKWFNPMTEKNGDKVQQQLGFLISNYTYMIKGAKQVIEKAVIPTLTSIANAPRTSPLADVNIDNILRFLAAIIDTDGTTDIAHNHTNLAQSICFKIANKTSDPVVPYLCKMLLYLEIHPENSRIINELITQAELLLEEEENSLPKGSAKHITKFVERLKEKQSRSDHSDVSVGSDNNARQSRTSNVTDGDERVTEQAASIVQNTDKGNTTDKEKGEAEIAPRRDSNFTERNYSSNNEGDVRETEVQENGDISDTEDIGDTDESVKEIRLRKSTTMNSRIDPREENCASGIDSSIDRQREPVTKLKNNNAIHGESDKGLHNIPSIEKDKNRARKENVICNSDTTIEETDSDASRDLRRSKRRKGSLYISSATDKSRSEKENSKKDTLAVSSINGIVNGNASAIRTRSERQQMASLPINNNHIVPETRRTLRANNSDVSNEDSSIMNCNGVKRKKARGKKSQGLDSTGDATLHTIIEQSHQ